MRNVLRLISVILPVFAGFYLLSGGSALSQPPDSKPSNPKAVELRLKEAAEAFEEKRWDKALKLYKDLVKDFPDLPRAHTGLAASAAKLGNYHLAVSSFHRAISLLPDEPIIQEELAAVYRQDGQIAEAQRWYKRAINAYIDRGVSATKTGDYSLAISYFLRVFDVIPDDATIHLRLADLYRQSNQLKEAKEWYLRAIKTSKDKGEETSSSCYFGLGLIEMTWGNYEEAERFFSGAVQLDPNSPNLHSYVGESLIKLNRLDEAEAAFQKALRQDNGFAPALFGLGQVALKRRDLERAKDFYVQAAEANPKEPAFLYSLSQVLFRLGDHTEGENALARYRRAQAELYLQKAHQLIAKNESQRLTNRGQWKDALAWLQKSVEFDPTFIDAIRDRAYVQMQIGEYEAAKSSYEQALKADPNLIRSRFHLGIVEVELKNLDDAESTFLETIAQDPQFTDSYSQLARVREMKGDLPKSELAFDLGIQKNPDWASGYWRRGKIRQKRGDKSGAESDFRRAIQLSPETIFPKTSLLQLLAEMGKSLDEALDLAIWVLSKDPNPSNRADLAFVYYRLGKTEIARREIENAYGEDPKNPHIQALYAKIFNLQK